MTQPIITKKPSGVTLKQSDGGVFDGISASAQSYIDRRGIAVETAQDGLGIAVKAAVDALDKLDGKKDGTIDRGKLVSSYRQVQAIQAKLMDDVSKLEGTPSATSTSNFMAIETAEMKLGLNIASLPATFAIPDAVQDKAVRAAVSTLDKDHNRRIMLSEAKQVDAPTVALQLAQDLLKGAVKR